MYLAWELVQMDWCGVVEWIKIYVEMIWSCGHREVRVCKESICE